VFSVRKSCRPFYVKLICKNKNIKEGRDGIQRFFKSTMKVATSIFFAVIALAIVGWLVSKANDNWTKREAKQYEVIKEWPVDLKEHLQMTLLARTKLVDGRLLAAINIDGYPAYLTIPRLEAINRNAGITLLFQDKDGFKVHSKAIQMPEFSSIVDAKGEKSGLSYEFDEYMSPETYTRFAQLRVQWTLDTVLPAASPVPAAVPAAAAAAVYVPVSDSQRADHCAPNLSKTDRLERLAQHGTVRQTGTGAYSVGLRSLHFFSDDSLLGCQ
jgi:hypothetical protein